MKGIILEINGKEVTLSMEELKSIVSAYFAQERFRQISEERSYQYPYIENEWYKVTPELINRKMFERPRKDPVQEKLRLLISDAFWEVDRNPDAPYAKTFYTHVPKNPWKAPVKVYLLRNYACEIGDRMATWIEQALEWAERLSNGESWEALCNTIDKSEYWRMIMWKNHKYVHVGGCAKQHTHRSRTELSLHELSQKDNFDVVIETVPVVVRYEALRNKHNF